MKYIKFDEIIWSYTKLHLDTDMKLHMDTDMKLHEKR